MLAAAVQRAKAEQRSVLASLTVPAPKLNPAGFFDRGNGLTPDCHFWAIPQRHVFVVGVGQAATLAGDGQGRFHQVEKQWRRLLDTALIEISASKYGAGSPKQQQANGVSPSPLSPALPRPGPLLMGGFAFDPLQRSTGLWQGFPDAHLAVPQLQLLILSQQAWVTANALVGPDDNVEDLYKNLQRLEKGVLARPTVDAVRGEASALAPDPSLNGMPTARPQDFTFTDVDPAGWQQAVREASRRIRQGRLEKVVLAREVQATGPRPLVPAQVLEALMERYPSCYVFAVGRQDGCFLGASPEQLVRLQGSQIQAMGLAGTARRGDGTQLDQELGAALLSDPKEREEHAVVVRYIKRRLQPLCRHLNIPAEPTLLRIHNVQHLFTPISGTIAAGNSLLDLVEQLHPTPAVGGSPRAQALADIRQLEHLDRGWYAAPVGWLDTEGDGEFTVAIRSALIRGKQAALFAGCGIMGDSDPQAEFEESRYKLRPMIRALAAGVASGKSQTVPE